MSLDFIKITMIVVLLIFVFSCHGLLVENLSTTRPQGQGELFSFQVTLVSFFLFLKVGLNTINKSINNFFLFQWVLRRSQCLTNRDVMRLIDR